VATFGLGESAPNSVRLLDFECVLAAFIGDGADLTYSLCPDFSTFPFVLSFLGARWKKEVRVVPAAQCHGVPGTIHRYHRNIRPSSFEY